MVYRATIDTVTNMIFMQVHYPSEAIQNVPFFESKLQLLEAQVSYHHVCNILLKIINYIYSMRYHYCKSVTSDL